MSSFALLKPLMIDALIDSLDDMNQQSIRRYDSGQPAIKLGLWVCHLEPMLKWRYVRNDHSDGSHESGREHNGRRGSRLDEGKLARPEEMDNKELIPHHDTKIAAAQ